VPDRPDGGADLSRDDRFVDRALDGVRLCDAKRGTELAENPLDIARSSGTGAAAEIRSRRCESISRTASRTLSRGRKVANDRSSTKR